MAYILPVGTADLDLTESIGTADLNLGEGSSSPVAIVAGETLPPIGSADLRQLSLSVVAGETLPLLGLVRVKPTAEYSPPVGIVDLNLTGTHAPPVGTADLPLGQGDNNRIFALSGETLAPSGGVRILSAAAAEVSGETLPPQGRIECSTAVIGTVAGEALAPVGSIDCRLRFPAIVAGETLAPAGIVLVSRVLTVDLDLIGGYTPPVGAVDLNIGGRWDVAAGTLAGETLAPVGRVRVEPVILAAAVGETLAPVGSLAAAYDPNLLSAVCLLRAACWNEGTKTPLGLREPLQSAPDRSRWIGGPWRAAALLGEAKRFSWRDSPWLSEAGVGIWTESLPARGGGLSRWRESPRHERGSAGLWREAWIRIGGMGQRYRARLPLPILNRLPRWQEGEIGANVLRDGASDGRLSIAVLLEVWQQAGYPGNAPNPGPPVPVPVPRPWDGTFNLLCPLPGTFLRIGRSPCILVAEYDLPRRRSYMTQNSASLVRWPDLTPLPVTAMTVETDFDSWCWGLTATLTGPDVWALVQPNPLACQVQATINGQVWRFLLDVPALNRSFNANRVAIKGRSRSAWLHEPFTPSRDFGEANAREMQQLGEAALDNSGWTLDWRLENWLVPAGHYVSWNTPIGELIRLATATDDGLYTHPVDEVITLHKRWPVASWLLDAETADIAIPDSAILRLTQNPVYTQPLNGAYVSGTRNGVLALVRIAGTDGALQPAEPITHELLCDENGVAARQRGLNVLSDSGAGWEIAAETLFAPGASPDFPLVPPGRIVAVAGMKGISRSCRITASRSGDALSVRQSIGLERREVEAP